MSAATLFRCVLCIHGLIFVSYFLFSLLKTLAAALRLGVGYRAWIGIGELLIALSILAPIGLSLVPQRQLARVEWSVFTPPSEGGLENDATQAAPAQRASSAESTARPMSRGPGLFERLANRARWSLSATGVCLALGCLAFGALISFACLWRSAASLRRLLRSSSMIRRVGRVRVAVTDEVTIPFSSWRATASWVVLPASMLENARDLRLAIRHELQHHRQADTPRAVLIEILLCVLFPNPFMRLWKREMTELQEFSCDEALLNRKGISPRDYGSCLVGVAEAALGARSMYAGTTCMAAVSKNPFYQRSFLRRRVEMFTSQKRPRARRWAAGLAGTAAVLVTMAVALGAEKSLRGDGQSKVNPGIAAVDPAIQRIAEKILGDALQAEEADAGFAIVAEPSTGKILAVANVDRTRKRSGHWALSAVYEPASLTKTLVAAQAIEKGLTRPDESHDCEKGSYRFGNRVYHDWSRDGWDHLTTQETIAVSSDICSIKIGEKLGGEGLQKMLVDFGFGPGGSASAFPEASEGVLLPAGNPYELEAVPAVTAGFGFRASPLELVQAYGAIANGGNLLKPKSADADSQPQVVRRVLSAESSALVRRILRQVVLTGTGRGRAASKYYSTAGKTATSYFPDLTQWELVARQKKGNLAGFIGFAPMNDPKVEVYVGINNPKTDKKGGAHGSMHAAPVFNQITEEVLKHMNVAPDLPQG